MSHKTADADAACPHAATRQRWRRHAGAWLAAACLPAALPTHAAGLAATPGYQGLTVWEATATPQNPDATFFAAGDARLVTTLPGAALTQSARDFGTFQGNENYDLYFSNADGTFNANGSYLTIDGNCDVPFQCFNIAEVALRLDGRDLLANAVVRAVYGRAGSFIAGSAAAAVDGNLQTYTALGDTIGNYPDARMSLTLAFAVPEPQSWALMLGGLAALGGLVRRARPGHAGSTRRHGIDRSAG